MTKEEKAVLRAAETELSLAAMAWWNWRGRDPSGRLAHACETLWIARQPLRSKQKKGRK